MANMEVMDNSKGDTINMEEVMDMEATGAKVVMGVKEAMEDMEDMEGIMEAEVSNNPQSIETNSYEVSSTKFTSNTIVMEGVLYRSISLPQQSDRFAS